jgi:hypothetical protein
MPTVITNALVEKWLESPRVASTKWRSWTETFGQRWPTVAWIGTATAIVLVVIGTLTFLGRNGTQVFSEVGSVVSQDYAGPNSAHVAPPPPPPPLSAPLRTQSKKFAQPAETVMLVAPDAMDTQPTGQNPAPNGPMIIRTAELSLVTKEFDKARANLEAILKRHRGYVGELKVGGATGSERTLSATLRVPADQLDATLAEIKAMGRVESESQSGQDVTSHYVDLQARLGNARNTEERLTELLRNRTGKLSDVLQVEQELDRVRGEIEQMEAERKNMSNQVSYAGLNATITEDYKAQLQVVPPSTSNRLSNAAVEGYRSMTDGVLNIALFLLSTGPTLLLWGAVLFLPARLIWKKMRRSFAS